MSAIITAPASDAKRKADNEDEDALGESATPGVPATESGLLKEQEQQMEHAGDSAAGAAAADTAVGDEHDDGNDATVASDWKDFSCATQWEQFINDVDNAIGVLEAGGASADGGRHTPGTRSARAGERKRRRKQLTYNGRFYLLRSLYSGGAAGEVSGRTQPYVVFSPEADPMAVQTRLLEIHVCRCLCTKLTSRDASGFDGRGPRP